MSAESSKIKKEPKELVVAAEELAMDPHDVFTILDKIGVGSYGTVYKAEHKRTGIMVAVKQIPVENDLDETIKEINTMTGFSSQYLIKFYASYLTSNSLWIVMEFCAAGSVSDVMTLCDACMTEEQIQSICHDILHGLVYLHSKRKIHRDIKAANILLDHYGHAKLADFGVTGQLADNNSKRVTVIGTPFWMAPEVIEEVGYGTAADVWSLGITCIEMAEGIPPYHDLHPMRAIFMIPANPPPTLRDPDDFSSSFKDFLRNCLIKNPSHRPTAQELLNHPFLAGVSGAPKALLDTCEEAIDKFAKGLLSKGFDSEDSYTDDDSSVVNSAIKPPRLDMTIKNNDDMFTNLSSAIPREDFDYGDTLKPDYFANLQNRHETAESELKSELKSMQLDSGSVANRKTVIYPNFKNDNFNNDLLDWETYFDSLGKTDLMQLQRLIDENEAKEKRSLQREFEQRLRPILDAIDFQNKNSK